MYTDVSSPTVTTQAVFTTAGIAARERRNVRVIDISGAYLNANMTGIKVRMRLDPVVSAILTKLDAQYEKFVEEDGTIVVELDKALYGCIESAKLWYEHISNTLCDLGFVKNQYDQCVFNLSDENGKQCTICLHVDDLMITSVSSKLIEKVTQGLKSAYGTISVHDGLIHSYLGMTFDFSQLGKVKLSMEKYVTDLIKDCEVNSN